MHQLLRQFQFVSLVLILTSATLQAGPLAPQVDSNRSIDAADIQFTAIPDSHEVELTFKTIVSSQLPGPIDMSMDVNVLVNGVLTSVLPLAASTPNDPNNDGCGDVCGVPACPPGAECAHYADFGGGTGCFCGATDETTLHFLAIQPHDEIKIQLVAAVGSMGEIFTDDDCATVTFEGFFPSLCNGDGGDQMGCTDCPCSNNAPAGTLGGCQHSGGTSSRLDATGDPSVSLPPGSDGDLRFSMSGGPAFATTVLLSGAAVAPANAANPCFGLARGVPAGDRDGLRCVIQSVLRHGNRQTDSDGNVQDSMGPSRAWGGESHPTAGIASASGFAAGQTRFFQLTHRDDPLAGCMRGLNTSQAIQVTLTP